MWIFTIDRPHGRRIRGRVLPSGSAVRFSSLSEKKKMRTVMRGASRMKWPREERWLSPEEDQESRCFTSTHYTSLRRPSAGRSAIHETLVSGHYSAFTHVTLTRVHPRTHIPLCELQPACLSVCLPVCQANFGEFASPLLQCHPRCYPVVVASTDDVYRGRLRGAPSSSGTQTRV